MAWGNIRRSHFLCFQKALLFKVQWKGNMSQWLPAAPCWVLEAFGRNAPCVLGKCVSIYWTIAAVTVLSSTRQITALGYERTNKTVSLKVIEHSSLVLSVCGAKWNCIFLLKWIIPTLSLTFAKKQYAEQRLGTGNQTCTDSAGRPL